MHRQSLIYKHIMSSIPVPPVLLLSTNATGGQGGDVSGGCYALQFAGRADAEPGRCRRTDGKKWRCSRNVTSPDQKYCERHIHRGRPRSRKSVELQKPKSITKASTAAHLKIPFQSLEASLEPRYPNWMKGDGGEMMAVAVPPNNQCGMTNSNVEGYWLNLNYTDLNNSSNQCYPFALLGGGDQRAAASRSFIDVWSTETSPTLALSMPSTAEEEADQIQMGLGLTEYSVVDKLTPQLVGPGVVGGGPAAEHSGIC